MNRRDRRRRPFRLRVQAEPGALRGFTADVSHGGLFFVTARVFKPGTRVRLMVRTPDGVALGVGVVRWAKQVPPTLIQVAKGGMGIEFTWISPELQALLDRSIGTGEETA